MSTSSAESTSLPAMKVSKEVSSLLALPAVKVQRSARDSGTRLRNSRIREAFEAPAVGRDFDLDAVVLRAHVKAPPGGGDRLEDGRKAFFDLVGVRDGIKRVFELGRLRKRRPDLVRADPEGLFNRGLREPRLQTSTKKSTTSSSG